MDTPDERTLRQMPYSKLKKYAKKSCGIKANLKADVLIASILEKKQDDDSFVAMEQKIINSCNKNKQKKFDSDKQVGSATPRRETYIIDSPFAGSEAMKKELIISSASPVLRKTPTGTETSLNVTMSRGSERRTKRKVSFVTPMRKSMRLNALTPHYTSVKDRPKTPIPSRASSGRRTDALSRVQRSLSKSPSASDLENRLSKISGGSKGKRPSTPLPSSAKFKRMNLSSAGLEKLFSTPVSTPDKPVETSAVQEPQKAISFSTPEVSSVKRLLKGKNTRKVTSLKGSSKKSPRWSSSKVNNFPTPKTDPKKSAAVLPRSARTKRTATPRSGVKGAAKAQLPADTKVRGAATPSLEKIFATPVSTPDKPVEASAVQEPQKAISFSTPEVSSVKRLSKGKNTRKVTSLKETDPKKSAAVLSRSTRTKRTATPRSGLKSAAKAQLSADTKVLGAATPRSGLKSAAKAQLPADTKVLGAATPRSGVKRGISPGPASISKKRVVTPNFNKIHQKAFDKMESIDEYQRRKDANSAKKIKEHLKFNDSSKSNIAKKLAVKKGSKIPKVFGGIPFIPSVTSTKDIRTDFASFSRVGPKITKDKKAVLSLTLIERSLSKKAVPKGNMGKPKSAKVLSRENTPLGRKLKFDLQASLSKKLPYKPHAGPLKPLAETSLNSTFHSSGPPQKPVTKNEVVKAKRIETRNVLRGVRKNRRFELQMQNRTNAAV